MFVTGNTLQDLRNYFSKELSDFFSTSEIRFITNEVIRKRLNMDSKELMISSSIRFSESDLLYFRSFVKQLQQGVPFQYLLGKVFFHSIELSIQSGALIPRPETEELVEWIIESHRNESPKILDIGTGSGCIALALQYSLKSSFVSAVDVSKEALIIANANNKQLALQVNIQQKNILEWEKYEWESFNIIVSNPPYITEREKSEMANHVLMHEPELALFVPDDEPLLFYNKIVAFAKNNLKAISSKKPYSYLYFETHERYADSVAELLSQNGFIEVEIKRDLQDKKRMVKGKLVSP